MAVDNVEEGSGASNEPSTHGGWRQPVLRLRVLIPPSNLAQKLVIGGGVAGT